MQKQAEKKGVVEKKIIKCGDVQDFGSKNQELVLNTESNR